MQNIQQQLPNSIEYTNDFNLSKNIMHSLSNQEMTKPNSNVETNTATHNKRSRLNQDDDDEEVDYDENTADGENNNDESYEENDEEVENNLNETHKLNDQNSQIQTSKSYTPISPVSSGSSSYQSDNNSQSLSNNTQQNNENNYAPSSSNDLMKMMLMIRQQQHHLNTDDNQLLPSPLVRTCSNSSSTSTGSSCSSVSTISSTSSQKNCLSDSNQYQNSSQPSSMSSSAASSLCTSTSNLSLMNETNLKAFMMSVAAAAGKPAPKIENTQPNNQNAALAAVAAFADQFAYMVRSRSSSLSDSSTSSTSSSSSNYSNNQSNNSNLNNLINMCAAKVNESQTSEAQPSENNMNEFLHNDLMQNSVAASLMKQMITTYQAAVSNNNPVPSHPLSNEAIKMETKTNHLQDQMQNSNFNSSMLSPISNRKSSSSSTTSNASSTTSSTEINKNNFNSSQPNLNTSGFMKQTQNNALATPIFNTMNNTMMDSAAAAAAAAKNDEIKAKINAVANKSIMLNGAAPTSTPCKVCGDEASGFHYGVDSCEGCKGFFRRCITQGMNHQCTNNQQCEMTPFSRNSCQFCRLKKCFAVGMSREASRLGRRPKRAKDDKESGSSSGSFSCSTEIGSSMLNNSNTTNGSNFATPNTTPLKQPINPVSNIKPNKQETFETNPQCNNNFEQMRPASSSSLLKLSTPVNLTTNQIDCMQSDQINRQNHLDEMNLLKHSPNSNKNSQRIKKDLKPVSNRMNPNDLSLNIPQLTSNSNPPFKLDPPQQSPTEKIISNNETNTLMPNFNEQTNEFLNKKLSYKSRSLNEEQQQNTTISLAQQQKETSQQQMQQIEMLTKLISISDRHTSIERTNEIEYIRTSIIESHCQIWPTTFEKIRRRYLERPPIRAPKSTDINNPGKPNEIVWDNFIEAMVPLIMDVVKYCKYIPGFNQILQHDQVQLLKQGSFEVICVNSFMLVDAQNKLMLTPDMEYLMDGTSIKSMPLGFFMNEVFELGIQVSPLKLTDSEIALFNAVLVMNPDRGDLQDKDHVEELQSTLLHVLYKHLKYYRSDEPDLFFKLLKLIPVIQEINRKHSEALNTVKMSQSQSISQTNNFKTSQPNTSSSNTTSSSSSSASTSPVKTELNLKKTNYMEQMSI